MALVQVPVGPWTRPWRPSIPAYLITVSDMHMKGSGAEEPGLDERWATGTMMMHSWTINTEIRKIWKSIKVPSGSTGNWVLEVFGMSLNSFWHVQLLSNLSSFHNQPELRTLHMCFFIIWCFVPSSCIFLFLGLIMTRLLFDAGELVFIFFWLQNSGHLILAGNAKLWGCYPNCSSESNAQGGPSNMKQSKIKKARTHEKSCLVVFRFCACFLKSLWLEPALTSQRERDRSGCWWCEENG